MKTCNFDKCDMCKGIPEGCPSMFSNVKTKVKLGTNRVYHEHAKYAQLMADDLEGFVPIEESAAKCGMKIRAYYRARKRLLDI